MQIVIFIKKTLEKDMIQFNQRGKKQKFVTSKTIITLQLIPKVKTYNGSTASKPRILSACNLQFIKK